MDKRLRASEALQLADGNGCAMPVNRPHNKLIEDRISVPPACNGASAGTGPKAYEGFDGSATGAFKRLRVRLFPKHLRAGISVHFARGESHLLPAWSQNTLPAPEKR